MTAALAQLQSPPLASRSRSRLLIAMSAGVLLSSLDGAIIATTLPTIVSSVGAPAAAPWIAAAYLFGAAVATPAGGVLGDAFGHRRVLRGGLWLLALSTFACGSAASAPALVLARLCQGLAGGAVLNANFTLAAELFPDGRRARVVGWMTLFFTLATLAGPILGGFAAAGTPLRIAGHAIAPWRLLFLIQVPVMLAVALLGHDGQNPPQRARGRGWGRTWTALLRDSVLRQAATAGAAAMAALLYLSIGVPALVARAGAGASTGALLLTALSAGVSAGAIASGRLIGAGRDVRMTLCGATLMLLAALLTLAVIPFANPMALGCALFLAGIGFGPLQIAFGLVAQDAAPREAIGTATALVQLSRRVGGAFGGFVGGCALGWAPALAPGLAVAPALLLLGLALVVSLRLPRNLALHGSGV